MPSRSQTDLESKYEKLLKAVQTTRDQQKKFFLGGRTEADLKQSKIYERELDEYVKRELKELADQKAGVQKLF
jgi:hypothetical protein